MDRQEQQALRDLMERERKARRKKDKRALVSQAWREASSYIQQQRDKEKEAR